MSFDGNKNPAGVAMLFGQVIDDRRANNRRNRVCYEIILEVFIAATLILIIMTIITYYYHFHYYTLTFYHVNKFKLIACSKVCFFLLKNKCQPFEGNIKISNHAMLIKTVNFFPNIRISTKSLFCLITTVDLEKNNSCSNRYHHSNNHVLRIYHEVMKV